MKNLFASIFLAIAVGASLTAQATIVTYNNEGAFLAAGSGFTTIDFEAENPNGPNSYSPYPSLNIGNVTFTRPGFGIFVFGQSAYPTFGLTSSYLAQNGSAITPINVSFANPVYGIGMNFGIQNVFNSSSIAVTFNLSNGNTIITTAPLLWASSNTMRYFGIYSDTAFSSFNVNGPSHAIAIDNLSYTSQSAQSSQSIPEPATLALMGLGLFGLAASGWRRK